MADVMSHPRERERLLAAVRDVDPRQDALPSRDWRGISAADRAAPMTELGRRLLGIHLVNTTPKDK
jgi:hypothetical protein